MDLAEPVRHGTRTGLMTAGWLLSPVIVVAFVLTRYVLDGPGARAVAQVVFLAPLVVATVVMFAASRTGRRGGRANLVWRLFGTAVAALVVSEAVLSYLLVTGRSGPSFDIAFDAANAVALFLLFAGGIVAGAFDRMGWRRAARIAVDGVTVLVLVYGLVYWVFGVEYAQSAGAWPALRLTAYALLGPALLEAGLVIFGNSYALRAPWNRILASALAALAVAATVWSLAQFKEGAFALSDAVSNVMYLVAYCLFMMAGLSRLAGGRSSRSAPMLSLSPAWPGIVYSTVVLAAMIGLVSFAQAAPVDGVSRAVYTGTLAVAAILGVVRTLLATSESRELTDRSRTDPLTGVLGPQALLPAWDSLTHSSASVRRSVVVYSIDVDDFASVNARHGSAAGDRILSHVARRLERAAGQSPWLFRLSDDEFIVIASVEDRGAAVEALGTALCSAVRTCESAVPVTASVGSAVHPADGIDLEELLAAATTAMTWAKRQGKNRYAPFDAAIAQAMSLDDRLAKGSSSTRDMARALAAASDARDPDSHDHARNVAVLSRMLAADLDMPEDHVERVELAALLHDVGKIALPNVMLGGKTLSIRERSVAREHSELGERLLEFLAAEGIPSWVRSHHERWDGQGYPDGLAGDDIPMESRIIALADAYDAMTAGRRYGAPMSRAAALQEIDLGMGVLFDPDLTERFISLVGTSGALGWSDDRGTA